MKKAVKKLIPKRRLKNITHPISRYLIKNNLTLTQFVKDNNLGMTPQYISMLIHGRRNLGKRYAIKIARAMDIKSEILVFPENYKDN